MFKNSYCFLTVIYFATCLPLRTATLSAVPPHWQSVSTKLLRTSDKNKCIQRDTCSCVRQNDTGINLHGLDTGPRPRFTFSSDSTFLQWNPCTGFTAVGIKGVAVTFGLSEKMVSVYGMQKTAKFGDLDGFDYIGYKGPNGNTQIILQCDESSEPVINSVESDVTQVYAVYKGPCNPKIPGGEGSSSLSGGSIILITLLVLFVLYITVGCLVNIYVRKLEGFERIPNYECWRNLPSLIKDGCVYTWRHKPGYEKM